MVISASYRTDLPGYYSRWFERRYRDGYCLVPHPFGGVLRRVPLRGPEVQGYVFWTRNIAPFTGALRRLQLDGIPFLVHYSILGYGREIERHPAAVDRAVTLAWEVADAFGEGVLVWRYDPILISSLTDFAWHRRNFAALAQRLAGATDEVVVSFATMYRKTTTNLRRASLEHGFEVEDPELATKRQFLLELTNLAAGCGLRLTVCSQRELLCRGLEDAACIDPRRLGRVAGRPLPVPRKAHRPSCGCHESVDIGAYDTCPTGCLYCYANRSPEVARQRQKEHRPDDLMLWRPRALRSLSPQQLLARASGGEDPHRDQLVLFDDLE